MAGAGSAAGGLDNSIMALWTQLSGDNRDGQARLIPQVRRPIDVIALSETLEQLTTSDSRQSEAIALILFISERNWSIAEAWLKDDLSSQP
jgi:hypothetical protein